MTDPRQAASASLDADAKAVVDRWVADLGREPAEMAAVFRFLVAMAARAPEPPRRAL